MRYLEQHKGWSFIPTYMTRQARDDEAEKISITGEHFDLMDLQGEFFCQTALFGNRYGTPKNHILKAANKGGEFWMLDFALSNKHLFKDTQHKAVVILPESWEQLARQLSETGRSHRLAAVAEDYFRNYHEPEGLRNAASLIVVNRRDSVAGTAEFIDTYFRGAGR